MKPYSGIDPTLSSGGSKPARPSVLRVRAVVFLTLALFLCAGLSSEVGGVGELWERRVNCGGDSLTTEAGIGFSPDVDFSEGLGYGYGGGSPIATTHLIGGTSDSDLYREVRNNFTRYSFEVPNGAYRVRLHFVDILSHHPGNTALSVSIQGVSVIDNLDIFERVERDYALPYQFLASVGDGLLEVVGVGQPRSQLGAIEVVEVVPHSDPPQTPVLIQAIGSYRANILNFEDNPEIDLAGYRVWRQTGGAGFVEVSPDLNLVSRFIDTDVIPGTNYDYEVAAVDIFGNVSPRLTGIEVAPIDLAESPATVFHVSADSSDLAVIGVDPSDDVWIPVTVSVNDTLYENVEMRYRGNVTRTFSKKSYKLKFPANDLFRGTARKINLNSSYTDDSLLRERLAMSLFREKGVPTPTIGPALLMINDHNIGVVMETEQVDEYFLENHDLEENTLIYKAGGRLALLGSVEEYMEAYTKETFEDGESWDDIIALIEILNNTPSDEMYEQLIATFDIENFLDYYRAIVLTGGWDFIVKNYFVAHNLETGIWQIYPWDQDLTFGPADLWGDVLTFRQFILIGQINRLVGAMLSVPLIRNLHLCGLESACTGDFSDEAMAPRVDEAYDGVAFDGERDWRKRGWEDNAEFYQGPEELVDWIDSRSDYVLGKIPLFYEEPTGLVVNELMAANATTLADEFGEFDDWIEIYNASSDPVSLASAYLTNDLSLPYKFALPDTVLPGNSFLIVWADEDTWQGPLHANFKLNRNGGEIALHRSGTHVVPVDLLFFGPQGTDLSWGRLEDGLCPFDYLETATPGTWNSAPSSSPDDRSDTAVALAVSPNPSFGGATIRFVSPVVSDVVVSIHDIQGRRVQTLYDGSLNAGIHDWDWDGRDEAGRQAPAGIYWIRATTPLDARASQLVLLR